MKTTTAKGDIIKLKPFIVFKEGKRDVEKLKEEYENKCTIISSASGWTDTDLALSWTNTVLGQFSFTRYHLCQLFKYLSTKKDRWYSDPWRLH